MRPVLRLVVPALVGLLTLAPAIAKAAPVYWSGNSAGYSVRWSAADLTFARPGAAKPIFSASADFKKNAVDDKDCSSGFAYRLLSVVGSIVTYEEASGGYCKGAAHPWADRHYMSVDLRRGAKPTRLTDWFPENDVLEALLGDRLVQKALKGKARPQSLKALLDTLADYQADDCVYGFNENMLTSFAFHHLKGDQVAVRIGLLPTCEIARGMLTQLGLYLPVPASLRQALADAAARRHGLLMEAAPDQHTEFARGDDKGLLPGL